LWVRPVHDEIVIRSTPSKKLTAMSLRNARSAAFPTMPALTSGEWRDVQRALKQVQGTGCACGERPGPFVRGLAKIGRFVTHRGAPVVAPELEPLRDFLCESARHGPAIDVLAERLQDGGFSTAQIAALSFIAG